MDVKFIIEYLQEVKKSNKETASKCDSAICQEYFLGRAGGIELAIRLLQNHIKEKDQATR